MTMMSKIEVRCAVCEMVSQHHSIQSTNAFGSPDLDTRPPEMERSTIYYWLQRCPGCGYSASDISECDPDMAELVMSSAYSEVYSLDSVPQEAATFLASSWLNLKTGKFSEAAWRAIHAAWVCDDEEHVEGALIGRAQAIELLNEAADNGQPISCQAGASETITVDLLRRSGQFDKALNAVEHARAGNQDNVILRILKFEQTLIEQGDTHAHTVAEALGSGPADG